MIKPTRKADGTLVVPARAEGAGMIGDAMIELRPGDPDYADWDEFLDDDADNEEN